VIAGSKFVDVLSRAFGVPIELHMAEDYEHLLAAVRAGGVALSWMPPFVALRVPPAEATLVAVSERHGSVHYRSALVVANTSRFHSVADLRGSRARVAWGDPQSASQYILPRHHLLEAGLRPGLDFVGGRFLSSGFNICAGVANGEFELGALHCNDELAGDYAGALEFLKRHFTAAPWRLRVIAITERIPADGIVLNRALDESTQAHSGLNALHEKSEALEALRALMNADRLVPLTTSMRSSYRRLEEIAALVAAHPPELA
ncbi:MAG TPA: PhnD/SsuA/transferrin family substrate-binding protein, partial [Polyangia bacterium]